MKQYDECRSSMVVGSDADSDAASNHRLSTRGMRGYRTMLFLFVIHF